ncbi:ras-domain-containing protein [Rickenella mellea]|uniref:Ras-domain-containing protein n=1 Tax=Rickenella mellea TaxID=50990 RepID=A0A4Y7PUR9_9AGAM|nr:ras-domain-containing protein [Rickenella mellea]
MSGTPVNLKFVIVGGAACGKTSLLVAFSKGIFPEVYVPTVFENYKAEVEVDGTRCEVGLWDTSGQDDYDHLRPLSYVDPHVILICFAIDSPDSLATVQEKWISEINNYLSGCPLILVGCKRDLRNDAKTIEQLLKTSQRPVTVEEVQCVLFLLRSLTGNGGTGRGCIQGDQGEVLLRMLRRTIEGVREVFEYSTRAALSSNFQVKNEQLKRNFRSLQNELDCVGGDAKILLSHERAASNRLKRAHQQEKMSLTIKLDDVRKELEALKTKYESELTNNASRTANLAVIRSDDDGAELISGLLDKSSGEIWEITPLNNNTYSIMNQSFGLYANCRMRPMKGDVVEAKERRKQWYIKESRSRGKYM